MTAVRSLFLRLKRPLSLSLSLLDLLQSVSVPFCAREPQTQHSRVLLWELNEEKDLSPQPPGCTAAIADDEKVPCCQGTQLAHFTTLLSLKSWQIFNQSMHSLDLVNNHCEVFNEKSSGEVTAIYIADVMCSIRQCLCDRETLPVPLVCLHDVSGSGTTLHCASTWACSVHRQPVWAVNPSRGCDGVSPSPVLSARIRRWYWLSVLPSNSHFSICTLCLFAECPICSSKYTWNSWYPQRLHCIKGTHI